MTAMDEQSNNNPHKGHRARLKERFLQHGLENFDDVNALELLLFFSAPRRDTNGIAHALIERFGSLAAVMDASPQELEEIAGIGDSAICLMRLIPAISRRYVVSKTPENVTLDSSTAAGRYLVPLYMYETEEVIYAVLLDARSRVILRREIGRGTVNSAEISARQLAELCMDNRASSVILSHNHPSGVAMPSAEDEIFTARVSRALSLLGVELIDHIVVAGSDYISMRESGLL